MSGWATSAHCVPNDPSSARRRTPSSPASSPCSTLSTIPRRCSCSRTIPIGRGSALGNSRVRPVSGDTERVLGRGVRAGPRGRGDGPRRGRARIRRRRVLDGVAINREAAGGARAALALWPSTLLLRLWRRLTFTGNSRASAAASCGLGSAQHRRPMRLGRAGWYSIVDAARNRAACPARASDRRARPRATRSRRTCSGRRDGGPALAAWGTPSSRRDVSSMAWGYTRTPRRAFARPEEHRVRRLVASRTSAACRSGPGT